MGERLERAFTLTLVAAAVATSALVIRREVLANDASRQATGQAAPTRVPSWLSALKAGTRIGDSTARLTVMVLSDMECPFCERFHNVMKEVLRKHEGDVAMVFVHLPLPQHRFAWPAARAVECAKASGRFSQMIDAIFANQDSLGLKSWGVIATEAGVGDTTSISKCARGTDRMPSIEAGVRFATEIGATGTPTVIVNGWRLSVPPTLDYLEDALNEVKKGEHPFGTK